MNPLSFFVLKITWGIIMKKNNLAATILSIGSVGFLGIIVETSLNIANPTLIKAFGIDNNLVQWLTSGYLLVATIMMALAAYLRRSFKIKTIFRAGLVLFFTGTVIAVLAPDFWLLLFGRLLEGIASGMLVPLMFSVIISQAPIAKRGFYMGLGSLTLAFAPAVGPVYGGAILTHLGWRAIFGCLLPLLVIGWLCGEKFIQQDIAVSRQPFDGLGALLIGIVLACGLLLVNGFAQGFKPWLLVLLAIIAVLCFWLFARHEKRTAQPILPLTIFKRSVITELFFAYCLIEAVSLLLSYLLPNFLQVGLGRTAAQSVWYILPASLINAALNVVAGAIYDRLPHQLPILLGEGIATATLAINCLFNPTPLSVCFLYICTLIGVALSFGNIMTYALGTLPASEVDDCNAWYMIGQSYGGAIGIATAAGLLNLGLAQNNALKGFQLNIILSFVTFILILVITARAFLHKRA